MPLCALDSLSGAHDATARHYCGAPRSMAMTP